MKSSKPWTKPNSFDMDHNTWFKTKKVLKNEKKRLNVLDCVYNLNKRKNYEILI